MPITEDDGFEEAATANAVAVASASVAAASGNRKCRGGRGCCGGCKCFSAATPNAVTVSLATGRRGKKCMYEQKPAGHRKCSLPLVGALSSLLHLRVKVRGNV